MFRCISVKHRARSESRPNRSRKIERNRADSRVRALGGRSRMTSAHFFGLLDPSLVTVILTQPISTIVSSSTPSVRTSYVNGPQLRVQRPRGRRSCPERRTHTRTRANGRTDEGERGIHSKSCDTRGRGREREGARRRELRRRLLQRTQDDRTNGRTV